MTTEELAVRIEENIRQGYHLTHYVRVGALDRQGFEDTAANELALRLLVAQGKLEVEVCYTCAEGHHLWTGPEAAKEEALEHDVGECDYCDDEYQTVDPDDLNERISYSISKAWRALLDGERPFFPEHYVQAKRAAEGAKIIEGILDGLVKTLLFVSPGPLE